MRKVKNHFRTVSGFCLGMLAAIVMAASVSCSPQVYNMSLEMRYPSPSGLNLTGKTVALVYPYGVSQEEMQLTGSVAEALADKLDSVYPESDSTQLFTIQYTEDFSKMATPDSLVNLVLMTDADVVFLFGHPSEFAEGYRPGGINLPLWCYDSLGGENAAVKSFKIAADAGSDASVSGKNIGDRISSSFVPTWREEEYGIWYRDNEEWSSALVKALDFKWDEAVKAWISILDGAKDSFYRACLEYNIGLGCYMMGNRELAIQWLTQSAAEQESEMTTSLLAKLDRK